LRRVINTPTVICFQLVDCLSRISTQDPALCGVFLINQFVIKIRARSLQDQIILLSFVKPGFRWPQIFVINLNHLL
jgi:hypothetical protein